MSIKSVLAKPLAGFVSRQQRRYAQEAVDYQNEILEDLLELAEDTAFGRNHKFSQVLTYADFKQAVPLRDYEGIKSYVNWILNGEKNVLWPGKPLYLAKTSGTTSGVKYIPITRDSIPNHINTARNALLALINQTEDAAFLNGKMIFLSGSPQLQKKNNLLVGRLSGIVNHHIPAYLRNNQLPTYNTNCIEDWELKLEAIVQETLGQDMRLISGIPPWIQMYFDRLHEVSGGKTIGEIFPNLSVIVHGGVNFSPYQQKLSDSIGKKVNFIETYPASEGFIAYQDKQDEEGLLLNVNSGIFFEFVPVNEIFDENPTRLSLAEVRTGENYAIVLTTNAGLWAYLIGDTVKFVSLEPPRIIVTGRIKHFISAFGEHVIAEEVEKSLLAVTNTLGGKVVEFHVSPCVNPADGLPHHAWWIEFDELPADTTAFAKKLDEQMTQANIYYKDLIQGNVLSPSQLHIIRKDGFRDYMKSLGKLGGQNKVPRLANDDTFAKGLSHFVLKR